MPRPVPERLCCSEPACEPDGTLIGSCGLFVPGRTRAECERLAAALGWQVQPQPLCPAHRAMVGKVRPVLDLTPPAPGGHWLLDAQAWPGRAT